MRTDKQREAARLNGAKSKALKPKRASRSPLTTIKHGLLAKKIFLLDNENEEGFLHRHFHRTFEHLTQLQRDRDPEAPSNPTQPPQPERASEPEQ